MRLRLGFLLSSIAALSIALVVFASSVSAQTRKPSPTPQASPSPTPKPEFRLNASAGHLSPSNTLYFLDGWFDAIKLALKFSATAKVMTRMNIADEKLAEIKDALAVQDLSSTTKAAKIYKSQIDKVKKAVEAKKISGESKNKLIERIHAQDDAFVYLKAVADAKNGPLVSDAWSDLQDLKQKL